MTPGEFTAALHDARNPHLEEDDRARLLARHFGLGKDGRELLEAALRAAGDRCRSIAVEDACFCCPYASMSPHL